MGIDLCYRYLRPITKRGEGMSSMLRVRIVEETSIGRKVRMFGCEAMTENGMALLKADSLEQLRKNVKNWVGESYDLDDTGVDVQELLKKMSKE